MIKPYNPRNIILKHTWEHGFLGSGFALCSACIGPLGCRLRLRGGQKTLQRFKDEEFVRKYGNTTQIRCLTWDLLFERIFPWFHSFVFGFRDKPINVVCVSSFFSLTHSAGAGCKSLWTTAAVRQENGCLNIEQDLLSPGTYRPCRISSYMSYINYWCDRSDSPNSPRSFCEAHMKHKRKITRSSKKNGHRREPHIKG